MPPRRKARPPRRPAPSDSDSSSDSEGGHSRQLGPELYASLQLKEALQCPEHFATAADELAALLRELYGGGRCAKLVQAAMALDVGAAIEACDGRLQSRAALAALMEAAERHLPQARRNALLRQYRQSGVQLARRERRHGPAGWASDEEWEAAAPLASFAALPPDVIELVFRRLDPLTLAKAACVSREWRAAASEGGLWEAHCAALLARPGGSGPRMDGGSGGKASPCLAGGAVGGGEQRQGGTAGGAHSSSSSSWRQRFVSLVAQHPQRLQRWKTTRVLVAGRLAWLPQGQLPPPRARHVSTAAVVAFCRSGGRHAGSAGGSSGGSDSSSSDSQGGNDPLTGRLRFWQL